MIFNVISYLEVTIAEEHMSYFAKLNEKIKITEILAGSDAKNPYQSYNSAGNHLTIKTSIDYDGLNSYDTDFVMFFVSVYKTKLFFQDQYLSGIVTAGDHIKDKKSSQEKQRKYLIKLVEKHLSEKEV
jgi:hypothetical protein